MIEIVDIMAYSMKINGCNIKENACTPVPDAAASIHTKAENACNVG
jgi:hypothetical protein